MSFSLSVDKLSEAEYRKFRQFNVHVGHNPIKKEGWLHKQGANWKTWRRRYFRLKDEMLFYYEDKQASKAKGAIPLNGCIVRDADLTTKKSYSFEIYHTQRRVFYLYASDERERQEWLVTLRRSIEWNSEAESAQHGSGGPKPSISMVAPQGQVIPRPDIASPSSSLSVPSPKASSSGAPSLKVDVFLIYDLAHLDAARRVAFILHEVGLHVFLQHVAYDRERHASEDEVSPQLQAATVGKQKTTKQEKLRSKLTARALYGCSSALVLLTRPAFSRAHMASNDSHVVMLRTIIQRELREGVKLLVPIFWSMYPTELGTDANSAAVDRAKERGVLKSADEDVTTFLSQKLVPLAMSFLNRHPLSEGELRKICKQYSVDQLVAAALEQQQQWVRSLAISMSTAKSFIATNTSLQSTSSSESKDEVIDEEEVKTLSAKGPSALVADDSVSAAADPVDITYSDWGGTTVTMRRVSRHLQSSGSSAPLRSPKNTQMDDAASLTVVVVGHTGAGKSVLLKRLLAGQRELDTKATQGAKLRRGFFHVGQHPIELSVWEIGGRRQYWPMAEKYIQSADVVLCVCGADNAENVPVTAKLVSEMKLKSAGVPCLIVLNKVDALDGGDVPSGSLPGWLTPNMAPFKTSAARKGLPPLSLPAVLPSQASSSSSSSSSSTPANAAASGGLSIEVTAAEEEEEESSSESAIPGAPPIVGEVQAVAESLLCRLFLSSAKTGFYLSELLQYIITLAAAHKLNHSMRSLLEKLQPIEDAAEKGIDRTSEMNIKGLLSLCAVYDESLLPAELHQKELERALHWESWLEKRGELNKGWKSRFFTLHGPLFSYYGDDSCAQQKGVIDLRGSGISHGLDAVTSPKDKDFEKRDRIVVIVTTAPPRRWRIRSSSPIRCNILYNVLRVNQAIYSTKH